MPLPATPHLQPSSSIRPPCNLLRGFNMDPLGPLLFCLTVHPLITQLKPEFCVFHLDEGTIGEAEGNELMSCKTFRTLNKRQWVLAYTSSMLKQKLGGLFKGLQDVSHGMQRSTPLSRCPSLEHRSHLRWSLWVCVGRTVNVLME